MAAEDVADFVEEPTVGGRSNLVEGDQGQVPAGSKESRRSSHPHLGWHPVVAVRRYDSVERARREFHFFEGPDDDFHSRQISSENGCEGGTQLDRGHSGASGNEALRSLARARTDLEHLW